MLKPKSLAFQPVVSRSFKLSIITTTLASLGMLTACSSTPQQKVNTTKQIQASKVKNDVLLDSNSFDSLEDLLYATDMRAVESDRLLILRHGDVWRRMTVGFKMDLNHYDPRIEAQRNWFISRQPYLDRLSARASRYLYYTVKEAERRGIPTELALLPVIESSYDPAATSSAAAAGLWQFVPSTGKIYGLRQSSLYDGRRDVVESTRAAYEYLTSLYNQFGSWELALASYNAGPGRIQQAINRNIAAGLPTDYWSLKLPQETMNYVPRFLAVAQIIKDPHQYGVNLPAIANRPHFREVTIPGSIDLNELSRITGVSRGELYALNPAHRGNYTDPMAPNRILIPNDVPASVDSKITKMSVMAGSGGYYAGQVAPPPVLTSTQPNSTYTPQPQQSTYKPVTTVVSTGRPTLTTAKDLATYAANADVPSAPRIAVSITPATNVKQISSEPPLSASEKQVLLGEEDIPASKNPTTENTLVKKVEEPAPTNAERAQVIQELERIAPKGTQIVDPKDGNIKLTAIQSSQSIADQTGQNVSLNYVYPKDVTDTEHRNKTDLSERNKNKPATVTKDEVIVAVPKGKRDIYTVQPGDTLLIIANKNGLNWRDIAQWNQIDPNATLLVGAKLYLYNAKPVQSDDSTSTANTAKKPQQTRYTVKSGDSLTAIAQQFNLSLADLAAWNNLTVSSNVMVGQRLTLVAPDQSTTDTDAQTSKVAAPVAKTQIATEPYVVKRGEYLQQIATRYGMSNTELAALTPHLTASSSLFVGQKIRVPKLDAKKVKVETTSQDDDSTSTLSPRLAKMKTQTYTVVAGDYLSTVAGKYKMSLADLAELNNIKPNSNIFVGQKLLVPLSKEKEEQKKPKTYRVQSGDNLTAIANKFDIPLADLASLNGLKVNSNVMVGKVLKLQGNLPTDNDDTDTSSNVPAKKKTADDATSTISYTGTTESYTVQAGESLTKLATRYHVSTQDLAGLNGLKSKASLHYGQKLKVPKLTTSYKVKSGDSLIGLSRKYGLTPQAFADMNNIDANAQLRLGQTVTVPNQ